MFKLDHRLENDSFFLQEINNFQIRLMNVQEFYWIVIIPIKPNCIELSDLEVYERNELLNFAVDIGNYIKLKQSFDAFLGGAGIMRPMRCRGGVVP